MNQVAEVNPFDEVRRLARGRSTKAIRKLAVFLEHEEEYVREEALEAIWTIAAKADALVPVGLGFGILALDDPCRNVREKALETVGDLGGPDQLPLVAKRIKDRAAFVRCSACSAVASLKGVQYLEDITACLSDSAPVVRSWAATALGDLGDPRAIPALWSGLAVETAGFCRGSLASSLVVLGDTDAVGSLLECLWSPRLWEVSRCGGQLLDLVKNGHLAEHLCNQAILSLEQRRRDPFLGDPQTGKRVKNFLGQVQRRIQAHVSQKVRPCPGSLSDSVAPSGDVLNPNRSL